MTLCNKKDSQERPLRGLSARSGSPGLIGFECVQHGFHFWWVGKHINHSFDFQDKQRPKYNVFPMTNLITIRGLVPGYKRNVPSRESEKRGKILVFHVDVTRDQERMYF